MSLTINYLQKNVSYRFFQPFCLVALVTQFRKLHQTKNLYNFEIVKITRWNLEFVSNTFNVRSETFLLRDVNSNSLHLN